MAPPCTHRIEFKRQRAQDSVEETKAPANPDANAFLEYLRSAAAKPFFDKQVAVSNKPATAS